MDVSTHHQRSVAAWINLEINHSFIVIEVCFRQTGHEQPEAGNSIGISVAIHKLLSGLSPERIRKLRIAQAGNISERL